MTFEEYIENLNEGDLIEWVNGELSLHNFPRTLKHQDLFGFFQCLLQIFVQEKHLGRIMSLPFVLKLNEIPSARQPDLMYISNKNTDNIKTYWLEDKADLIIEIVSPESIIRDTQDKFEEYEKAGVKEYWTIDPKRRTANFYELDKNKEYKLLPLALDTKFESRVIEGLWIKTDWLWQEELPNLMDILKEWGLV